MVIRVYGGYPSSAASGNTYVFATIGTDQFGSGSCSASSRGSVYASLRPDSRGVWNAYVSVQGEYGSRAQTVEATISADRREASFSASDEILKGADGQCFSADGSYGEGPEDPDQPGGYPYDSGETGYFNGFEPGGAEECGDTRSNLAYSGSGNPRFIAWGRIGSIESYVDQGSSSKAFFSVAAADPTDPISYAYSAKQTRGFQHFPVRVGKGDGSIRTSTTWTDDFDGCTYYSEWMIETGRGRPVRIGVRRAGESVVFRYPRLADCAAFRQSGVRVVVRGLGRRVSLADKDTCDRESTRKGRGRVFSLATDKRGAYFRAKRVRRDAIWRFRYVALVGRRPSKRGSIIVRNTYEPGRRIYAWKGDRVNDAYWNYCVNRGKQTWMHNGNAYCVRPADRDQSVRLR